MNLPRYQRGAAVQYKFSKVEWFILESADKFPEVWTIAEWDKLSHILSFGKEKLWGKFTHRWVKELEVKLLDAGIKLKY